MESFRRRAIVFSLFSVSVVLVSLFAVSSALATNGMNLEGYGPIATGMGGASMAYDNGSAAVMNNPATLGLMPEGNRIDVALGLLGPDVTSKMTGMPDAESSADLFLMPAFGWVAKSGKVGYGAGVFAQGGMGTEYSADTFMAAGSGDKVMSQVSMGRFLVPFTYDVTDQFKVGATIDFVWAAMDIKMALSGAQFSDMVSALGGTQTYGTASGSMVNTLAGAFGGGMLTSMSWARFDFADESDFSGKAKGNGFGGKIGAVYEVNKELAFGFAYHSKTAISDLEATGATLSMNVSGPATGGNPTTIPVTGTIKIKDFQWPQMLGLGTAYRPTSKLLLVLDYKWINWKDVMKNFTMTFTADASQSNPMANAFGLGGQTVDATLFQNWKDQHVFMLGAGYQTTDALTLRAGVNVANNPIPSMYENPLFPATIKTHVMAGAGYAFSKATSADLSFTYAPEVEVKNGSNVTTTHSQMNSQIMVSYRF